MRCVETSPGHVWVCLVGATKYVGRVGYNGVARVTLSFILLCSRYPDIALAGFAALSGLWDRHSIG